MGKNKSYYDFCNYEIDENKRKTKLIKIFILVMIVIIVTILAIITAETKTNIELSLEQKKSVSEVKTKLDEEKEKLAKEMEEAKKRREEKLPKLTEVGRNNMENIYKSETKRAFITFDDGPSSLTPEILDTLKNENVKATFFMLGMNVDRYPETVKRVYDEGHFIASHGYTHQYSSIYSSTQAVLDEYNQCNDAIKRAIGEKDYNCHLFRFPGGLPGGKYADIKQEAKQLLSENDILSVDWNALTGDAETTHPVAENLLEKLRTTTQDKNSVVILMHDAQTKKITAEILPQIIAYLKEQGYELKSFYDIIK